MEANNLRIPYNFTPRNYQIPLYNALSKGIRYAVAVWHRRAGKDKTEINFTASQILQRVGAYYYFLPTYTQGKKIIWDGMDYDGFPMLGHFPEGIRRATNNTEMKIHFKNGSLFQVVGSDNIDSIVGTNPVGCVFSEYSLQDPNAWEFIRPILLENGGWAHFNYTPRGHNHGWDLYQMAKSNPAWFCQRLTVDDTGSLTKEQIAAARADGMTEDMIQQEFFCSFEASIPGAYYANEMRDARAQGRICGVPAEAGVPVFTFWDLGVSDYMSVWFAQFIGKEIRLVHYYQNCGEGLTHYVNYIKDWRNAHRVTLGKAVLPHDGANRSIQTGKSSYDYLSELGMECELTQAPPRKQDGIEASRRILGRCWFDDKEAADGIEALTQYRKEWKEKNGVFGVHPLHDVHSHGADGFQTMAIWLQNNDITKKKDIIQPARTRYANSEAVWMGA